MFAKAVVLLSSTAPEVKLEHKGEELSFTISVFGRASFQAEYDVFSYINQYWASLPEQEQDEIFAIYREIQFGFDNIWSNNALSDYLSDRVKLLLDKHDLDKVYDWVRYKSDINIPSTFVADYSHSLDNNTSREKTYTQMDYIRLVTLALVMRTMIPIWGQYIHVNRKEIGTLFKEFYAFQLLNKSDIVHSVPIEKLKVYIDNIVGQDKYDPNNTLKGISSEDFGYWLLSLVCVKRLCIGDLRGLDPNMHMITFIYKFIKQKVQNSDNNFENVVKEKVLDDKSSDAENKVSTLERYRIKTNISPGEIVELEFALRDIYNVSSKLTCLIDFDMLDRSLQTSLALLNERIVDPQMILLRWIFKPVISPMGILHLNKPTIVRALGALESILWARGHKYLAILASAHPISSDSELVLSPVDAKMRVPEELAARIEELYPFTKTVAGKKTGTKTVNLCNKAIDNVANKFMTYSWRATAADALLEEVFGNTSRKIPIRPDIKTDLTKLVIELGSKSWI